MKKWNFILFLSSLLFVLISNSFSIAQNKLYFCEQYQDGKEVGVSEKFTTGWLTVMIDLRPANETINVRQVDLKIVKIQDSSGNAVEELIDIIPFDVDPDWDYIYFTDYERIAFNSEGLYEIICQKKDGTSIVSGVVEIVPNGK